MVGGGNMYKSNYFITNTELAKEKSDLQIQLQKSVQMNNLLLKQSYDMHSKLTVVSNQVVTLQEKNSAKKVSKLLGIN